jgi:hypothetical protein
MLIGPSSHQADVFHLDKRREFTRNAPELSPLGSLEPDNSDTFALPGHSLSSPMQQSICWAAMMAVDVVGDRAYGIAVGEEDAIELAPRQR